VDSETLIDVAKGTITGLVIAAVYCAPAIIAAWRQRRRAERIALLNLVLGWTGIGWIILLVWAAQSRKRPRSR
jgi:hypothetical protein